jgi:hypothetical protein
VGRCTSVAPPFFHGDIMKQRMIVGGAVHSGGELYEPDAQGVIEVPEDLAQILIESHGAQAAPEPKKTKRAD